MNKFNTKAVGCRTKDVAMFDGHHTVTPTSTIEVANSLKANLSVVESESHSCKTKPIMRSRSLVEEFEFQIARGWLNTKMAANYLGVSVKTLYNLKSKGLLISEGGSKSIFTLKELDKTLKRMKG